MVVGHPVDTLITTYAGTREAIRRGEEEIERDSRLRIPRISPRLL